MEFDGSLVIDRHHRPRRQKGVKGWVRGHDPWHPDAYKDTPLWQYFVQPIADPQKEGWWGVSAEGDIIAFVPDGTAIEASD